MESEAKPDKKSLPWYQQWKLLVVVVLVFSLAALSGWQYVRAKNLQSTIGSLKSDLNSKRTTISGLESQTADLNKKVVSLEATIKELEHGSDYEAPTYDLTINSVRDETIFDGGFPDDTNKYLYIAVTIKNTSSSEGFVSPLDFTLKNSDDEKQPNYKEHPHYYTYRDASGSAELLSQNLAGGGIMAKGTLLFIVGKNDKDFSLRYDNETYDISVD